MKAMKWLIMQRIAGMLKFMVCTVGLNVLELHIRGCYDLEAHEKATGKSLRAWRSFEQPITREIDRWTIEGAKAGPAFRALAGKVKQAVEELPAKLNFLYK